MEKKMYESIKTLKNRQQKGEKLNFAERNILNITERNKIRKTKSINHETNN